MKEDMIMVPRKEWEELKKTVSSICKKVDDMYSRDTEYISMSDLCDWLHISRTTLWRYRSEGRFHTYVIGGKIMANKTEIQGLINEGKL